MKTARGGTVNELLVAWSDGDMEAREALVPLVHRELLSRATITREWQSARAWLHRRMTKGRGRGRE